MLKYISCKYFVFYTKTFDSFKTTIAILNIEIYGASKTVRLAKRNVEKALNGPDRRQASNSRATSERSAYKKELRQVEVSELPISCIFRHRKQLILLIVA